MSFVAVAVGVAVLAAGMSAYSASEQADAQKKALDYQSKVDQNNAKVAQEQRSVEIQNGQQDVQRAQFQQAQLSASQKATMASNGIDLGSGSALDIMTSTKALGNQDVNAITNNAARAAWGYGVQSNNYQSQSNLERWQSSNINPAKIGVMTGVGSLLSSASSYYSAGKK